MLSLLRYSEIDDYDWRTSKLKEVNKGGMIGHFTQVVWGETKSLGMGLSYTRSGDWNRMYAVARYRPAGNFRKRRAQQVKPLKKGNWFFVVPD